ncbi:prephenate dehydratase [Cribrihabitans neustonicus]|uniref:prephenate dehydratase n=1 Tax=Cribrihabitans neustonicus TaxID=1429085 RepID=UPI003B5AE3E8
MNVQIETPAYNSSISSEAEYAWVGRIHTLGPSGTNCEKAALAWAGRKCPNAAVSLHRSMEQAASAVAGAPGSVLLSVVAYPQLHSIIYEHLGNLRLIDVFIMNTDNMVLASSTGEMPVLCATHPAPEKLLPPSMQRIYAASNVLAAAECAEGRADGCITTLRAAERYGLTILRSFGPVPMGFTIHGPCRQPTTRSAAPARGPRSNLSSQQEQPS